MQFTMKYWENKEKLEIYLQDTHDTLENDLGIPKDSRNYSRIFLTYTFSQPNLLLMTTLLFTIQM